jgi:hypothetical protein
MTCGEFNPQLDAVLAGDVAESEPLIGAACEHHWRCASCSETWSHVRSLEVISVLESNRDVEKAVAQAREQLRACA